LTGAGLGEGLPRCKFHVIRDILSDELGFVAWQGCIGRFLRLLLLRGLLLGRELLVDMTRLARKTRKIN